MCGSLWPHPCRHSSKDKWGWGTTGIYTIAQGFSSLQATHPSLLTPKLWKSIWSPFCIPKVNFFTWLLMHKKALIGENLNKRWFHGPFRCYLCTSAIETSNHLLVDCVFTQEVWKMVLYRLSIPIPSHISVCLFV